MAYAAQPTVNCALTYGAGGQGAAFGLSISGSKIDKNCADLEAARKAPNRLTYCKIFIKNSYVSKAGVTLEDCLGEDRVAVVAPVPVIMPPVATPTPVQITVKIEQPEPKEVITATSQPEPVLIGTCQIDRKNVCKRIVDGAILRIQQIPGTRLRIVGSSDSGYIAEYLNERNVSRTLLDHRYSDDQNGTVSFYVLFPTEQALQSN
jgi:hypothetical protein